MIGSHEVAWVAALLDSLPDVDVITVELRGDTWWPEPHEDCVPGVVLRIHADSWADALLLVEALRLAEVEDRHAARTDSPLRHWRTWRGWCAEGSRETAVTVEVTAAEGMHAIEDGAA